MLEGYLVDFLSLGTISRFLVIPRHSASVLVISRRDADRRAMTRSALGGGPLSQEKLRLSLSLIIVLLFGCVTAEL